MRFVPQCRGFVPNDMAAARRLGMYLCRRHTGLKLRDIGASYGVGESAVTNARKRLAEEMKQSKSLRKTIGLLERELGV